MKAVPDSRPVDELIKDAIAEPIIELQRLDESVPRLRRGTMLTALVEEWDRIDPRDVRWEAVEALILLDADGYSVGLPVLPAMREAIATLLAALLDLTGQVDDGIEWQTMRRAERAIGVLPELYAQLETEAAKVAS